MSVDPLNIILFHPVVDIIIFLILFYSILYFVFIKFFKGQLKKLMILDIQWFLIVMILFYLNYGDQSIVLLGDKTRIVLLAMLMATLVEVVLYILFSKKLGIKTLLNQIEKKLK